MKVFDVKGELFLDQAIYANLVRSRVEVWYRSMVTIISAVFRYETAEKYLRVQLTLLQALLEDCIPRDKLIELRLPIERLFD